VPRGFCTRQSESSPNQLTPSFFRQSSSGIQMFVFGEEYYIKRVLFAQKMPFYIEAFVFVL
jgi:hypothetical protein